MARSEVTMATLALKTDAPALAYQFLAPRQTFDKAPARRLARLSVGALPFETRKTDDLIWALIDREGHRGLPLRAACLADYRTIAGTGLQDAYYVIAPTAGVAS